MNKIRPSIKVLGNRHCSRHMEYQIKAWNICINSSYIFSFFFWIRNSSYINNKGLIIVIIVWLREPLNDCTLLICKCGNWRADHGYDK